MGKTEVGACAHVRYVHEHTHTYMYIRVFVNLLMVHRYRYAKVFPIFKYGEDRINKISGHHTPP